MQRNQLASIDSFFQHLRCGMFQQRWKQSGGFDSTVWSWNKFISSLHIDLNHFWAIIDCIYCSTWISSNVRNKEIQGNRDFDHDLTSMHVKTGFAFWLHFLKLVTLKEIYSCVKHVMFIKACNRLHWSQSKTYSGKNWYISKWQIASTLSTIHVSPPFLLSSTS